MSEDEMFDRWVVDAAADYNRPPATVPREAMWSAIRAGVATAPASGATPSIGGRWTLRRVGPMVAAAAVLVAVAYQAGVTTGARRATPATPPATRDASPVYDVATRDLFDRAEVLLTTTRSSLGDAAVDPAVTRWAQDMLSETRLLLDSPAAATPERRALLEDLELTLAKIVRLSSAASADDKTLVDRSLRDGDLLSRLRTSVPAPVRGT
ncbi:MAG: hypothetical protein JNJ98_09545 [Gemmatimonadetes bacterium]|nr:hypothetical protein [Gemmatimonadota bacterium]